MITRRKDGRLGCKWTHEVHRDKNGKQYCLRECWCGDGDWCNPEDHTTDHTHGCTCEYIEENSYIQEKLF